MSNYTASWKQMVLRSMGEPLWLKADAPDGDVVVSTRVRVARNLRGWAFPHHLSTEQLHEVQSRVIGVIQQSDLLFDHLKSISRAEQEYLLGTRLISPEFQVDAPGRVLILDPSRAVSIMVNEEDHLRMQVLTAGWSLLQAKRISDYVMERLRQGLEFASTPEMGYLTSSPANCGPGLRTSALLHLVGLAHTRKAQKLLLQCAENGIIVRGLFGESSRAVGAFFQLSSVKELDSTFVSVIEHMVAMERKARAQVGVSQLQDLAGTALDFAVGSRSLSLADSLRVLAWARWAASAGLTSWPSYREVDRWVASLEVPTQGSEEDQGRRRADDLRTCFGR